MSASGGSPMSIAIPTGEQPSFVLDMSASFLRHDEDLMTQFPSTFFKALGLGTVFQMLGGILAGIWNEGFEYSGEGEWAAPHQGAFISVFDVKRFADVSAFKEEMDRYIGEARSTKPITGQDRADLAGGARVGMGEGESGRRGSPSRRNIGRCWRNWRMRSGSTRRSIDTRGRVFDVLLESGKTRYVGLRKRLRQRGRGVSSR